MDRRTLLLGAAALAVVGPTATATALPSSDFRRIFVIDVGNLPIERAKEYVEQMIGSRTITLVGEPRSGGYMFFRSQQLPGFSVMLGESEYKDKKTLIKTVEGPITAFVEAEV